MSASVLPIITIFLRFFLVRVSACVCMAALTRTCMQMIKKFLYVDHPFTAPVVVHEKHAIDDTFAAYHTTMFTTSQAMVLSAIVWQFSGGDVWKYCNENRGSPRAMRATEAPGPARQSAISHRARHGTGRYPSSRGEMAH